MGNLKKQRDLSSGVVAIMVPFPAQGHLNQLMQLSCLLTKYNIPVHFASSATHNRQAKTRVNGLDPLDVAKIQFYDVPTPPFESPAPIPDPANKFPVQVFPSWTASLSQREPVTSFVQEIASKSRRVVVIHDALMAFIVQDVADIVNVESYVFNCISAFNQAVLYFEKLGKPFPIEQPKEVFSIEKGIPYEVLSFVHMQFRHLNRSAGYLHNTCRLIEGRYLDLLQSKEMAEDKKTWAIGPILPAKLPSIKIPNKCLQWLDEQETESVLFVSFGTTVSLSDEEIKELAIGLEQSRQKFIWVLRDADKGDIFDGQTRRAELPEGWEKRVEGIGIVVRDWAPQPEILAHPATGGFMSHCGWNSCIESLSMGVPIAAWPMHSDQVRNGILVTETLKVGILVRDCDQSGEIVRASTIENVVKRLMATDEGAAVRKRTQELGESLRQATEEDGVSRMELDSFVDHIAR